ncbi:hypothetical protein KC219_20880, partial [Mycobacterium tuberculosis]|nr:hypothetical protein [Mycobacterium tuberculosis]
ISITGHRDHRYLSVTVDDDGPGIPPTKREEVFKPFLRLDDARNEWHPGGDLGQRLGGIFPELLDITARGHEGGIPVEGDLTRLRVDVDDITEGFQRISRSVQVSIGARLEHPNGAEAGGVSC